MRKKSDRSETIDRLVMQLQSVVDQQWKDVADKDKMAVYLRCYRAMLKKIGPTRTRKPKTE
jgi:hypothetical protein